MNKKFVYQLGNNKKSYSYCSLKPCISESTLWNHVY